MESLLLSGGQTEPEEIQLLDGMYKLRHAVFAERLKWTSLDSYHREIDLYDVLNPVYLICRDPAGGVVGCWRLLPTTGPYMLKDIFSHLLHGAPAPEQPDVWEISRFAIDPKWRDYNSLGAVGSVVGQMLLDLFDFSEANGIARIVAASDIRFDRILKRAGLATTHYGPAVHMENSHAVAGWADITPENRERIEQRLAGPYLPSVPAATLPLQPTQLKEQFNGQSATTS
jgi:acyl homoserine lactone synthase